METGHSSAAPYKDEKIVKMGPVMPREAQIKTTARRRDANLLSYVPLSDTRQVEAQEAAADPLLRSFLDADGLLERSSQPDEYSAFAPIVL